MKSRRIKQKFSVSQKSIIFSSFHLFHSTYNNDYIQLQKKCKINFFRKISSSICIYLHHIVQYIYIKELKFYYRKGILHADTNKAFCCHPSKL